MLDLKQYTAILISFGFILKLSFSETAFVGDNEIDAATIHRRFSADVNKKDKTTRLPLFGRREILPCKHCLKL